MIEVFKTNVRTKRIASKILRRLSNQYPFAKINFDLEDCDKILRVESEEIIVDEIKQTLSCYDYQCELLQ
jgi:hypothetical protein